MNEFNEYAISPEIRRALNGLQYTEPTEVQRRVIPAALQKKTSSSNRRRAAAKPRLSAFRSASLRSGRKTNRRP